MMYQNYRRAVDECPAGMFVLPVQWGRGIVVYDHVPFDVYYLQVGEDASTYARRGWDGDPSDLLGDERDFPDNPVCRRYVEAMSDALQDEEKALLTFEETMNE